MRMDHHCLSSEGLNNAIVWSGPRFFLHMLLICDQNLNIWNSWSFIIPTILDHQYKYCLFIGIVIKMKHLNTEDDKQSHKSVLFRWVIAKSTP